MKELTPEEKTHRLALLKDMVEEAGIEWKDSFTQDEVLTVATIVSNIGYQMAVRDILAQGL